MAGVLGPSINQHQTSYSKTSSSPGFFMRSSPITDVSARRSGSFCCLFASVDDTQGSEGSGTEDLPATAEDIPKAVLRYHKRRLKDPREDSGIVPAAKRTRIEAQSRERRSTQGKEDSGKGAEESSAPRAVSLDHPSSIRKGTHAAEILSCSPEITHSINFILIGEILQSKSFV